MPEILNHEAPTAPVLPPPDAPVIPLLESGDHLTRDEFERRYEALPEVKKAELIEGRVYMPSPVRHRSPGKPHGRVMTWLGVYAAATPGIDYSDNATVRMDEENEPQPDALLFIDESWGGNATISTDDYLEGAPELIVEVAASSAAYDLHEKLEVYRRNGVREYAVWQVWDGRIDWFHLADEKYVALLPDADGVIRSRIFPGLWLDAAALLSGDLAGALAVLQQGLSSAEHGDFAQRLETKRSA